MPFQSKNNMDKLINTPGLQHIAEKIFLNLDHDEDIMNCQTVNQSCQKILTTPMFWFKKWIRRGLSKENQIAWKKAIQITRNNTNYKYENNIVLYMKKVLKKKSTGVSVNIDIPCFIDEESMKRVDQVVTRSKDVDEAYKHIFGDFLFSNNKTNVIGCIQLLAPLVENPNGSSGYWTNMLWIVDRRNLKLIKALAPLIDNPNEPDTEGETPISMAVRRGYTEEVKILAPLSSNLNTPSHHRMTSLKLAELYKRKDIIKILKPYSMK